MPRIFLPLLILSIIACCIEVEISVPGFPAMTKYFNVSDGMVQLTIAYNFLGFCIASLFYGPLSECLGRRKVMIVGNAILLIGAVGCVFAPTIQWLLAFRFIQGFGASTSAVVIFAMIADAYHGEKAAKLIGIMNCVLTSIMALAPVFGGLINEVIGWRGSYAAVAAICMISWGSLILFLPETKKNLDVLNLKKVMQDFRKLLTDWNFISSSLVPSLMYSAYMTFVTCASFLYMETFGLPMMLYVLHQASIVAAFAIISFFSGKIIDKFGSRNCIINGTKLCLIGSLAMTIVTLIMPMSPYLMTAFMILYCIGFAICYPVVFAKSLEIFPEIKGTASSAVMSMRMLLSSLIIGLTGYLYNGQPIVVALMILSTALLSFVLTVIILKRNELLNVD